MFNKERLLAISELKLKEHPMTDVQFERYVSHLNTFIDNFPAQADKLRNHLDEEAYDALAKDLYYLSNTLKALYAADIAQECQKQADALVDPRKPNATALESFVENMILSVSSLSIDIQMASYRKAPAKAPAQPAAQRPAAPIPAPVPTPIPAPAPSPQPGFIAKKPGRPLILAVDNAVMFLNTLKKLLQDAPYDLHCSASGAEAMEFLQSNRPDIILLDVEMPVMDGYELARKIKNSGQRAPIVFITANSAREYVDKAIDAGGVGLLMKPVRINQLLAKIKEFI